MKFGGILVSVLAVVQLSQAFEEVHNWSAANEQFVLSYKNENFSDEVGAPAAPPSEKEIARRIAAANPKIEPFQSSWFDDKSWLNEFDIVIVIDKEKKGEAAQTMHVFEHGNLTNIFKVSTGRERWEPQNTDPNVHGAARGYISTTPTGYYNVEYTERKHHSNLWQSDMPFAVFFNGGIAMHQAPVGTEKKLGQRASGGCVRLAEENAEYIFKAVNFAGRGLIPQIDRLGKPVLDADGNIKHIRGYKTLVIVEDVE